MPTFKENGQTHKESAPNISEDTQGISSQLKENLEQAIIHKLKHHLHANSSRSAIDLPLYNYALFNGAERVMKLREDKQAHRHEMERRALTARIWQIRLPQIFSLILGLSTLGAATFCILNGHPWPAALMSTGGMAGLVTAYIKGINAAASTPINDRKRRKSILRNNTKRPE